jgi:hypothetical protein
MNRKASKQAFKIIKWYLYFSVTSVKYIEALAILWLDFKRIVKQMH